jgi:probable F420-dependent oxidoreductase
MDGNRAFRFGAIVHNTKSAKDFTELARRVEGAGFSTLFVPDHFVDHELAPTVALAHAAAVTDTLRIGPLVLGNDYKHPVVLAREAASLDLLSDGRLELGIGAGWMTVDYEKAGMELDPPGVRIARLAESIAILKGLFADGAFSFAGDHYRVTELDGQPKPAQRPHPPFIVGGGGPKILALAAREAEIVGVNANLRSGDGSSPDAVSSLTSAATDRKLEWLREAAGPDHFAELEIQTLVGFVHLAENTSGIIDAMASSFGVEREDARLAPVTLVGTEAEIAELLEERRERWQMSYVVVPAESVDALAPVVARLAGT